MSEVLLRVKQVQQITGMSRSAVYVEPALLASRVTITPRCVAWPKSAVDAWVADKIAASRAQ